GNWHCNDQGYEGREQRPSNGHQGAIDVLDRVPFICPEEGEPVLGNGLTAAPYERNHDAGQQDEHQERERARQVLEQEIHQRIQMTLHDGSMALHRWRYNGIEECEQKQTAHVVTAPSFCWSVIRPFRTDFNLTARSGSRRLP